MPTWDDVVASALRFPGVEETTSYGTPSVKVGKKLIARLRTDPVALMIRTPDLQDKSALLNANPDVFFTIRHYDGYAGVLVHLDRVDPAQLDELIEDAWRVSALKRHLREHAGTESAPAEARDEGTDAERPPMRSSGVTPPG